MNREKYMQVFYVISAARLIAASFAWINFLAIFILLEILDALDGLIAWFTKNVCKEKNVLDFWIDLYAQGYFALIIAIIAWNDWIVFLTTLIAIKFVVTIARFRIDEKFVIINPPIFKIIGVRLILEALFIPTGTLLLPITIAILILNPIFEYLWHYGFIAGYKH